MTTVTAWIAATRPHHLCLLDVLQWQPGHQEELLLLDRNWNEYGHPTEAGVYPATDYFKRNKVLATYLGDYSWEFVWCQGGLPVNENKLHICTEGLATSWCWRELDADNTFTLSSEELEEEVPLPERTPQKLSISDFPALVRVGWRGPCLRWSQLAQLPPILVVDRSSCTPSSP